MTALLCFLEIAGVQRTLNRSLRRRAQDQQSPVRGRTLGGAANEPAHDPDEQTAADQNSQDEKNMAPGQFAQDAKMVSGFAHGVLSHTTATKILALRAGGSDGVRPMLSR
ncbi:MAG: hypothetical protein WCA78_02140 [Rhizomicrobium sp.]